MNQPPLNLIEKHLIDTYQPSHIELIDNSSAHAHHPGMQSHQYHLILTIQSAQFENQSTLEAHRHIYKALKDFMPYIHALSIKIIK